MSRECPIAAILASGPSQQPGSCLQTGPVGGSGGLLLRLACILGPVGRSFCLPAVGVLRAAPAVCLWETVWVFLFLFLFFNLIRQSFTPLT